MAKVPNKPTPHKPNKQAANAGFESLDEDLPSLIEQLSVVVSLADDNVLDDEQAVGDYMLEEEQELQSLAVARLQLFLQKLRWLGGGHAWPG